MTSPSEPPSGGRHGEIGTAWSVPPGGPRPPAPPPHDGRDGRNAGGLVLVGVLTLCAGALAALQGIAALAGDGGYARVGSYVYRLNLTGWGCIHLVLGVLVAATGAALLRGAARAVLAGLVLAALSLVAQFLFLPYEPLRSVTVMAIDVCVIAALAPHRGSTGRAPDRPR